MTAMPVDRHGVTLSMLNLVPGGMGGSEVYGRELVRALSEMNADVSLLLPPVAAGFSEGLLPERVAREYPTGATTGSVSARSLQAFFVGVRSQVRRSSKVLHYPFTMRLPGPQPPPADVVSLLDVQHRDLPELFRRAERLYRPWAYDAAARHADAVITISEFCKARIIDQLGIAPSRIHVAPLGRARR